MNSLKDAKQSQFKDKIFTEQMDILYRNLFISIPSGLLCAIIIFIALYIIPHSTLLLYWFSALIIISVLRFALAVLHVNGRIKPGFSLFLVTSTIAAAIWGVAGSILMPEAYPIEQMIVIVVIAGVAAGGVQSLQASLISSLIYSILLILPLAVWVFSHSEIAYLILGFSIAIYLLFIVTITLRGYSFLKETLKLKYENIALAENVTKTNTQLQNMNRELVEKENNLRLIHDNAPIGMAIVSLDGKWLNVNNKLCEIIGYNKEELENLTIQDVTFRDDLEIDSDTKAKLLAGKLQSYQIEKRYVNKNHQLIWIITNISLVRDRKNKPLYYISQIQDINDRKQNEMIISGLSNMNEMLQLCHNSKEAYPIISSAAKEIFPDLSGGLTLFNKLTNEQDTVARWGDEVLLKSFFKSEECWAFRSGNVYVVDDSNKNSVCYHFDKPPQGGYLCLPLIVQGEVLGLLNFNAAHGHTITSYQQQIINNFSEIIKLSLANIHLNEALSEKAIRDALTGLYNRRYLHEWLPQTLEQTIRAERSLCVSMLDIDFFKRINDTYGHEAGDEVLKFIGSVLKDNLRESDIVCRVGGEEFVVVLNGADMEQTMLHLDQMRMKIKNAEISFQNHPLPPITLSIGIAEAPRQGETVKDILQVADAALYMAKEGGRDRIVKAP